MGGPIQQYRRRELVTFFSRSYKRGGVGRDLSGLPAIERKKGFAARTEEISEGARWTIKSGEAREKFSHRAPSSRFGSSLAGSIACGAKISGLPFVTTLTMPFAIGMCGMGKE
jgi:hypothetical protein